MKITLRREQESIIPKKMAKKNYEAPKMDEVKVNTESLMQTASAGSGGCTSYVPCSGDCTEDT